MNRKSIFGRLVFIFLCAGIGLILSFAIPHKLFSLDDRKNFFINNVEHYTELIIERYKTDPSYKEALFEKSELKILKISKEQTENYLEKNWHHIDLHQASSKISFDKTFRHLVVLYQDTEFNYIITNEKMYSLDNLYSLIMKLGLCLLVLFLTYRSVTKLFSPLKVIQKYIDLFSHGNLTERIPVEGNTQFTDLSIQLNEMASELENKLEERKALLLAISHEIKTPLASARLNSELLEQSQYSNKVIKEINEIDNILNKILITQRSIDEKENKIEKVKSEEFLGKFPEIETSIGSEYIEIDQIKMEIILNNLIENSKKYAGDKVEVIINSDSSITVRDFGPGVDENSIPLLTKPFYRADKARTRGDGTGLGLYLVEKLVKSQGMRLEICNQDPGLEVRILK